MTTLCGACSLHGDRFRQCIGGDRSVPPGDRHGHAQVRHSVLRRRHRRTVRRRTVRRQRDPGRFQAVQSYLCSASSIGTLQRYRRRPRHAPVDEISSHLWRSDSRSEPTYSQAEMLYFS